MTTTPISHEPASDDWWTQTESPKAWMTVRDADLYEGVLHRVATLRPGRLRVVEWGAGRSTAWYTAFLDALGVEYTWLSLEHHREFVDEQVRPALADRKAHIVEHNEGDDVEKTAESVAHVLRESEAAGESAIVVASFDHGYLRPDLGNEEDRKADLSAYVSLPGEVHSLLGEKADLAVIDGRHRRACVVQAAQFVHDDGFVMLHDSYRQHYQCAWAEWRSGRQFGYKWWIGSQRDTQFEDIVPPYALHPPLQLVD